MYTMLWTRSQLNQYRSKRLWPVERQLAFFDRVFAQKVDHRKAGRNNNLIVNVFGESS